MINNPKTNFINIHTCIMHQTRNFCNGNYIFTLSTIRSYQTVMWFDGELTRHFMVILIFPGPLKGHQEVLHTFHHPNFPPNWFNSMPQFNIYEYTFILGNYPF